MFDISWVRIVLAAIIPLAIGSLWYGPLFGNKWMSDLGFSKDDLGKEELSKILSISLAGCIFMSFFLKAIIEFVHKDVVDGQLVYASTHTFGHGAFHGAFWSLLTIVPVLLIIGLFERKSWANFFIHAGFWVVSWSIMGGVLDVWV